MEYIRPVWEMIQGKGNQGKGKGGIYFIRTVREMIKETGLV